MEDTATTNFYLTLVEDPKPAPTDPGSANNVQTGDILLGMCFVGIVVAAVIAMCVIEYLLVKKFKCSHKE